VTTDELIDDLLRRESGYVDHRNDRGGCTNRGITSVTLGSWRNLGRRATCAEVKALSEAEARDIYRQQYVTGPKFDRVPSDRIRALLVDWGVNSGPVTATKALQRILNVTADGVIGPETTQMLFLLDDGVAYEDAAYRALVRARGHFLADLLQRDESQRVFAAGWLRRLMEFV
jgi:lysozyme family protein